MNIRIAVLLLLTALFLQAAHAEIRLPKLVSDGMVLQRDTKINIWGWADAGEKVSVKFKGKTYKVAAGADGKWTIALPPTKAGGPYTMIVSGATNSITISNILIGDVWLCAGQSNMVHNLGLHADRYAKEIVKANYPQIRQFLVPTNAVLTGESDDLPDGSWKEATPQNVLQFSIIGYFFSKKLHEKYKVPIGFINASVGGTPIEAWISEDGFKEFPDISNTITTNKDTAYVNQVNRKAAAIRKALAGTPVEDIGMTESPKWFSPDYTPTNWHTMNIPGYWEDQGIHDLNGVVWFRREVDVPASMTGKPARISMGRIVDADHVYINGVMVGNKTYQYPQRRYDFADNVLKPGKNTIVVRVANYSGKGGFVPDKPYYLAAGQDTLDLKGYWQYKVGAVFKPQRGNAGGISAQNQPTSLFNGMVAPYTKFPIKGALWYQGESNTGRPKQYEKLLPALVRDWRNQWSQPALPVLVAQLPNFMDVQYLPSESQWAELREAQRKILAVPNTALIVSIDLGEWNDIHPGNKKPIGDRMALAAERIVYGDQNVVYSGPMYSASSVEGRNVTLTFDHIGSGLISSDGEPLRWFALAGDDKKFEWADARIEGNKVIVSSEGVSRPVYVRYAWADNPQDVNFYNKEGLPASPFEAVLIDISKLWKGKKAAVVLTYDDALDVHLDNVIPVLDSLGFAGTFYLSAAFPGSKNRLNDWKRAARSGHELGNHTLYHPCDGSKPGRSWVSPQNDLSKYTTSDIVREIDMTNVFLSALDGKTERTFAYTCGDMTSGEGSFVEAIRKQFVSMRGVTSELNKIESLDLSNVNAVSVDDSNGDELIAWVEKARKENALLVFLFHGVGGGHNINVDLKKHNALLSYLKEHEDEIWVTTMLDASKHVIQQKKK